MSFIKNMLISFKYGNSINFNKFCSKIKTFSKKQAEFVLSKLESDCFEKTLFAPDYIKINRPIENCAEYFGELDRLKKCKANNGEHVYFNKFSLDSYKSASALELGLIPYCGFDDCSKIINMYLSGRLTKELRNSIKYNLPQDMSTLPDLVRLLEYSLKHLDKIYGKFQGIVFRHGFMNENPSQYVSATTDYEFAAKKSVFTGMPKYSVIKIDNGHKIYDFQKNVQSPFAETEHEILLSFKNRYKKLSEEELTPDLTAARKKLASNLFAGAAQLLSGEKNKLRGYTKNDLLNLVSVYVRQD